MNPRPKTAILKGGSAKGLLGLAVMWLSGFIAGLLFAASF